MPIKRYLKSFYHGYFHPGVKIGDGSYVDRHAKVDRSVVIGRRTQVFPSALQGNTVLEANCLIGRSCRLSHSYLGTNVRLEPDVQLYRSRLATNVSVQTGCYLNRVELGRFSYVGRETYLDQVCAGSFLSIGPRCLLGLGDHPTNLPSTSPVFYSDRQQCGATFAHTTTYEERRPIALGHDVWLGAGVFVRDGVTIGHGAIIAAGAIVAKDVPPYAVMGGVPAKPLRFRYSESIIQRLLNLAWWNWDEARLRAAQPWFAQPDIERFLHWAET